MNFPCIKCGETLYGIVPDEWPFQNVFPITCSSCGEQQVITAKGIMNWTEIFEVINRAFTVKGICFTDISDSLPKWEMNQDVAPKASVDEEENAETLNSDAPDSQVIDMLTWRKKSEMAKSSDN